MGEPIKTTHCSQQRIQENQYDDEAIRQVWPAGRFVPVAIPGRSGSAGTAPCSAPEYRQFDFWLGQWTAYSEDGKKQGTNHLQRVFGDCGIRENWVSGQGAFTGTSFNF
ncbi:MAG: hypothetical protein O3B72_04115 [Proteobacteria bacterium]|nr:hypothetical protein [Pseudomonadota bacterium]